MRKRAKNKIKLIADYVSVESAFARSVHTESDFLSETPLEYHVTPCAREALRVAYLALETPSERPMTLIGPYGAGKSAFCVFLARLFSGDGITAKAALGKCPKKPLVPILIVGSRRPIGKTLVSGLMRGLENAGLTKLIHGLLEEGKDGTSCRQIIRQKSR